MNKSTLIIAAKQYLVRKGLVALFHELATIEVLAEIDEDGAFFDQIRGLSPNFLVVDTLFFRHEIEKSSPARLFRPPKNTKFVGIVQQPELNDDEDFLSFFDLLVSINDPREVLIDKLSSLFDADELNNEGLTQREKDIVRCVALGLTNKEIAEKLFISPHTVITHRKNITKKLEIKSVSGLTVYAILNNLVAIDEVKD